MLIDKKLDKSNFVKVEKKEVDFFLEQLNYSNESIRLWEKNTSKHQLENFRFDHFDEEHSMIFLTPEKNQTDHESKEVVFDVLLKKNPNADASKNILYLFQSEKTHYLSSGVLKYDKKLDLYYIKMSSDIFRFERRENFRLPVPPVLSLL